MNRRTLVPMVAVLLFVCYKPACPQTTDSKCLLPPYFPSPAHQFVWRNWDLVQADLIAAALKCEVGQVQNLAATMGLGPDQPVNKHFSLTWFTILRRNWDFVPFSQICVLLDMPEPEVREMMIPYNFVNNHLGPSLDCPPIRLEKPVPESNKVIGHFRFPKEQKTGEERFTFLKHLKQPIRESPWLKSKGPDALSPRLISPYSAIFGDVLKLPDFDKYYSPEVLANIARMGLDGIWLHGMLREMVPSKIFPEFGKGHEQRLRNLKRLIGSAKQVGLGVYVFLNEPRGMPDGEFYEKYPETKGAPGRITDGTRCLCTSTQMVKDYIVEATKALFDNCPDLEGVLLITASEAPTNCYFKSRDGKTPCPRCVKRSGPEVVAEVCQLVEKGVHLSKPEAKVIIWDWSWMAVEEDPQEQIIKQLPKNAILMVDYERGTPIERWGVKTEVNEYCLSVVGPSPRAQAHAKLAQARNMPVMAKIQVGNTWELGYLPYIPVPHLVARKFQSMLDAGISGAMESWTLGTYPSINWEVAQAFYKKPVPEMEMILYQVAAGLYGKKAAPKVLEAWLIFDETFQQYPFQIGLVYSSFVAHGPAYPIWFEPTGKKRRIMRNYDNLRWTNPYGPDTIAKAFGEMASNWKNGVKILNRALNNVPPDKKPEAQKDVAICRAVYLYFKSISNQTRFLILRKQWQEQPQLLNQMSDIVREEIKLARQFYKIARSDSRVGYEPAMQYFHLPLDIREK
ncbi:MAG: hypothetical protein ACYTBZ_28395, partial [Planctomycetota bacterium]